MTDDPDDNRDHHPDDNRDHQPDDSFAAFLAVARKANEYSALVTAVIAVAALIVAIVQINVGNATQREATAQNIYSDYLKLAIEHPQLANGYRVLPAREDKPGEYSWFVSFLLHSGEHIYLTAPYDATWRATLASQIAAHTALLCTGEYQEILARHYDPGFQQLVIEARGPCPAPEAR